jgi:hypothetical protein
VSACAALQAPITAENLYFFFKKNKRLQRIAENSSNYFNALKIT